jgi:hypothetical protein
MYSGKIAVPPGGGGLRIALSMRMRDFVPQSQFSSCKSEISVYKYSHNFCDQKLASDSSGLPGGFSGQRAWVRIFKKWAPGSYCLELVVACPAAGTSAQILLVEGS